MARFSYQCYDSTGRITAGEIAAPTRESALEMLKRKGELAFHISEDAQQEAVAWWNRDVFPKRFSSTAMATFTRELACLIKADIPVDDALRIISLQPMLPMRLRLLTRNCHERLLEGESLSSALAAQGVFPDYYTRLVKAGETSGGLAESLEDLARTLEHEAEAGAKLKSALVYPAVLMLAAAVALGVIVTVLIPAIMPLFDDAGAEPPLMIRVLSALSGFLSNHGIMLLALLSITIIAIAAALRSEDIRGSVDRALLALPIFGALIERRETAWLSRSLALLLRNGVPLIDAMQISSGVLSNRTFSSALDVSTKAVKEGASLTTALSNTGVFPDLFLRLTAVGEKTSQLDIMQQRVADIYESAARRQLDRLVSLVTPLLTLVIGGCVGGLIISVMSAIFSVNDLVLK